MPARKLPWAAWFSALLMLLPMLALVAGAVTGTEGAAPLARLRLLVPASRQTGLLANTLLLSGGAALFAVLLGAPPAFLAARSDLPAKRFFRRLFPLPLLIPPFIHAIVWTDCLGGGIPGLASLFPQGALSVHSLPGGMLVFAFAYSPFVTLIVLAGLEGLPRETEESALLARGGRASFFRVTLPLVFPQLACSSILVFLFTMVNFEVADILRVRVYPLEIFIHFSAYYNEGDAALLTLPLVVSGMLLLAVQAALMRNKSYAGLDSRGDAPLYFLGRFRALAVFCCALPLLLGLFFPLAALSAASGGPAVWAKVLDTGGRALWNSVGLALAAATVITVCALAVAFYLERGKGPLKTLTDFSTQIPLGVPGVALGIASILVYNRKCLDFVYTSHAAVVLAFLSGIGPFIIRIIAARIKKVDRELEEAGLLAGRGGAAVFIRIVLPLAAPGIFSGFYAAYALCLANLGIALLLVPPGSETAPIAIYNYMHYGAKDAVAALSLLLLASAAAPLALWPLARRFLPEAESD
jgi:iron(III) transport system permease protein